MEQWRVGELAKRTGLSVRTLHHYESLGLLMPVSRTEAGHRLYGMADLLRLQQIRSLQQLGFALAQIRNLLLQPDISLLRVVQVHRHRLEQQVQHQQQLVARLGVLERQLSHAETPSTQELFTLLETMQMFQKYYTTAQLDELQTRANQLGEDRIREVEGIWPNLIAQVRQAMTDGLDPSSEPVQALAQQWMGLVQEMTGGNPAIQQSIVNAYQGEPTMAQNYGLDSEIFAYIGKAMKRS